MVKIDRYMLVVDFFMCFWVNMIKDIVLKIRFKVIMMEVL